MTVISIATLQTPRRPAASGGGEPTTSAIIRLTRLAIVFAALVVGVRGWAADTSAATISASPFATLIERLSEPGGDFGGDNLISNEQSYLHVMPALARAGATGGAYIGVGPDQNFSYIAHIKPAIAYIIDIRRDNLLLQLLFKALFAEAPTRVEYLSLLTGRPVPDQPATWREANIDAIIRHIDQTAARPEDEQEQLRHRLGKRIAGFGLSLSNADLATIASCHRQFVAAGLSLVFQARGQPPRSYYPSFRTLLRETDRDGRQLGFLATESGYQFVRSLQSRDQIVPVVGDVSGNQAMSAIAADMKARGVSLSAFYISNVEYYLYRNGSFARYARNLQQFPHDQRSIVIRSVFPSGGSMRLPQSVPGFYSTSITQPFATMLEDLANGRYRSYQDLIQASAR